MKVWKKTTIRYLKDGKQTRKGTVGAEPHKEESKRFYGTLVLSSGKKKQQPLTEDKDTSEKLLRRLQGDEDKKKALGITETESKRFDSIDEALKAFTFELKAKGNTAKHIKLTNRRIEKLLSVTKTKKLCDLNKKKVLETLDGWKKTLSYCSINHYITAIKSFSRWLVNNQFLTVNPLPGLKSLNVQMDRRILRRPFTDQELQILYSEILVSGKTHKGSDWHFRPVDRKILYFLAANTGLRVKELSSLELSNFCFETRTLTVEASNTKNRKKARLPLSLLVCETVQEWYPTRGGITKNPTSERLFPGSWMKWGVAGRLLKADLKVCGIERNANGQTLDFHSLRYTFITNLVKSGVHPAKAQRLARHSDIRTSFKTVSE